MKKSKILLFMLAALLIMTTTALAKPIIKSDSNYFDINTGRYILEGNVYIETGSRIITAGKAQVSITSLEVWGQGGVTVKQDDILFHGDSVYVYGGNKTASIDGGVSLERGGLSISANSVQYNWGTKIAGFSGNVAVNDHGNAYSADYVEYDMNANKIL